MWGEASQSIVPKSFLVVMPPDTFLVLAAYGHQVAVHCLLFLNVFAVTTNLNLGFSSPQILAKSFLEKIARHLGW